ncbi:MAG: hypothetical protein AB3X46_03385 [Leptothrix ochracea]|uniref:hypothetical protein n=1 Tax=Leptothrix ochracea TaxID=735331 RepID=UPI0034E28E8D
MIFKRLARYSIGLCGMGLWIHTAMAAPAAFQSWRQDGACDVKPQTLPAPVVRHGCALAWRIALEPGQQLDICQVEEDVSRVTFELSSPDEDPSLWELAVMGATFEASAVRIERARRTEDGQWRTLLAVRTAQTQGMGVSRWSLRSLETTSQVSESIETEDWGVMSFATQLPAAKGCHVLISRWLPGHEPGEGAGRGDGLYVVGRWYQWGGDGFLPQANRPVVYRRYRRELERLRDDALDAGHPVHWANSPRTKTVIGPYPLP